MNVKPGAEETPQAQASDPRRSAWVSANAGSGKTTVLVRRVIRLLLDGVPPGRILCLTYTKAAAAHMANEVLKKLSAWVRLDDDALDRAIAEIESGKPSPERRARARRLFAAALETPGGLKVQTIHAFCDRVLHMFPVEADAPAGFEVLDDLGERDLIESARLQVLLDAGRNPESALGKALAYCIEICGDETIEQVIGEAVRARRELRGFDPAILAKALGLNAGDSVASVETEIFEGPHLPRIAWQSAGDALIPLGGFAKQTGERILRALGGRPSEAAALYLAAFFKSDGEPRDEENFGSKQVRDAHPALFAKLAAETKRVTELREKLRAVAERDRSLALFALATAVVARYEEAKRRRGVLDFADLVTKTVELLEREESAWVHFKLDGGISHILVDEAQDTSPEQWRIIAKLAEEFFAGKGVSDYPRTIFAVGDEKQSIFSFQGADPERFAEMRNQFAGKMREAGQKLEEPRLRMSYRSTRVVLGAVDKVFESPEARAGLSKDTKGPFHEAVRQKAPGMVEIWEPAEPVRSAEEDDGWDKPLDKMRETSAQMRLARKIARAVQDWIHGGMAIEDRKNGDIPRAVEARDIIILVQSRGPLFDAILRALKREGVPVAGADRLKLTENIAVMDMLALGDALLLAEDDLSLACVLKSPLFGFSDDDLFALCHGRKNTLAHSLAAAADARYAAAAKTLARWREAALHLRPFDFYSRVLGRDGGRRKMIARLGPEAADALDEFLAAALSYEATETPSLHGFLSLLRRADSEVKRDFEAEGSSVRVMTAHGVKGLEAPVIVLADTTTVPHASKDPRVVPVRANGMAEDAPLIWAKNRNESSGVLLDASNFARGLRMQEYRRLLYVALTRAADVLVVCGALNKNQKNGADEGSWYDLVYKSLAGDSEHITRHKAGYSEEEVLRWRTPQFPPRASDLSKKPVPRDAESPAWLGERWAEGKMRHARLRPSFVERDFSRERATGGEGGKARGILLHRLLQSLPEIAREEREAAALRYLAQAAPGLSDRAKPKLLQEALDVIDHPDCAEIFAPGSRAEPELVAQVIDGNRLLEIPARLDRVVVGDNLVTFADFKSGAFVPASLTQIPEHYISQLAAYRTALLQAFPGRRMRALLIFTAAPRVFEIPEESLESAWRRLITQGSPAFA
jgi:ATP-dependent helicase/nuclease subunit A